MLDTPALAAFPGRLALKRLMEQTLWPFFTPVARGSGSSLKTWPTRILAFVVHYPDRHRALFLPQLHMELKDKVVTWCKVQLRLYKPDFVPWHDVPLGDPADQTPRPDRLWKDHNVRPHPLESETSLGVRTVKVKEMEMKHVSALQAIEKVISTPGLGSVTVARSQLTATQLGMLDRSREVEDETAEAEEETDANEQVTLICPSVAKQWRRLKKVGPRRSPREYVD